MNMIIVSIKLACKQLLSENRETDTRATATLCFTLANLLYIEFIFQITIYFIIYIFIYKTYSYFYCSTCQVQFVFFSAFFLTSTNIFYLLTLIASPSLEKKLQRKFPSNAYIRIKLLLILKLLHTITLKDLSSFHEMKRFALNFKSQGFYFFIMMGGISSNLSSISFLMFVVS